MTDLDSRSVPAGRVADPPGGDFDLLVAGGGVTGLVLAHQILKLRPGWRIQVLDAGKRPGGTMRSERVGGSLCEWGPAGFLTHVSDTRDLALELGLAERLLPARSSAEKRFLWTRGALRAVPLKPQAFLRSDLLTAGGRGRVLLEPFVKRGGDADESIHAFARRRIGGEAASTLIDAMVSGIYAGDPAQLSLRATFPRMAEMERRYGSLVKAMIALRRERKGSGGPAGPGGTLTTFDEGMEVLIRALSRDLGPRVRSESQVVALAAADGGYRVDVAGRERAETLRARRVVLALPAFAARTLLEKSFPRLASLAAQVPYAGISVACLVYARSQIRHPLDGFGFLVPRGQGVRMLGAIWVGSIFPTHVRDGRVLLRVMIGGARDPEGSMLSEGKTVDLAHGELDRILGGIEDRPVETMVFRHPKGIPQYVLGHPSRLAGIDQELGHYPGLHLAGNAYRGIGVNDCVREARNLAGRIAEDDAPLPVSGAIQGKYRR